MCWRGSLERDFSTNQISHKLLIHVLWSGVSTSPRDAASGFVFRRSFCAWGLATGTWPIHYWKFNYRLPHATCLTICVYVIAVDGDEKALKVEACHRGRNKHRVTLNASFWLKLPSQRSQWDIIVWSCVYRFYYIYIKLCPSIHASLSQIGLSQPIDITS